MSKKKLCKSCSGPLDDFKSDEIIKDGFCPYCVDKKGNLKSYGEILDGMLEYIEKDHKEIEKSDQLTTAQEWLSEGEVWKEKFVEKDIVIDSYRNGNLRGIPKHKHENEGFEHSCLECMYYQECDDNVEKHEEWLTKMQKKYGDCGNLLYYKGKLVGFIQYAPKNELSRLKELEPVSIKGSAWFIACIFISPDLAKKTRERLTRVLLQYVVRSLKRRKVEFIEILAPLKEGIISSTPFSWDFYKKFGFKKKSDDGQYAVGSLVP